MLYLFFPHEKNNQKPKTLHLSSLIFFLFLIIAFQSFLSLFNRIDPGVLGYASYIDSNRLLEITNQKRAEQGLAPLIINEKLQEAARQKASAMFSANCWSHNCSGRTPWWFFKNSGYNYLYAGENLARDFADSESIVSAWMNSPTHRDNILNGKYQEIGFSVVDGVLNGEETTLVVQLFGTPQKENSIAEGKSDNLVSEVMAAQSAEKRPKATPFIIKPVISSFMLTKTFAISLVILLIIVLAFDTFLVYQKGISRISGKSFIHLSFFIIILISILLYYQGQIL